MLFLQVRRVLSSTLFSLFPLRGTQWPTLPFPGNRDLVLAVVPAWIRGEGAYAFLPSPLQAPPPPRLGRPGCLWPSPQTLHLSKRRPSPTP